MGGLARRGACCCWMEMVEESKSGDGGRLARRAYVWSWRKGGAVEPEEGDEDDEDERGREVGGEGWRMLVYEKKPGRIGRAGRYSVS